MDVTIAGVYSASMAIEQGGIFIVSGPRFLRSHPKDHSNKVAIYDKEGTLSQTELAKKKTTTKTNNKPSQRTYNILIVHVYATINKLSG